MHNMHRPSSPFWKANKIGSVCIQPKNGSSPNPQWISIEILNKMYTLDVLQKTLFSFTLVMPFNVHAVF